TNTVGEISVPEQNVSPETAMPTYGWALPSGTPFTIATAAGTSAAVATNNTSGMTSVRMLLLSSVAEEDQPVLFVGDLAVGCEGEVGGDAAAGALERPASAVELPHDRAVQDSGLARGGESSGPERSEAELARRCEHDRPSLAEGRLVRKQH